ncbi:MAG: hypothetical protein SFV54_29100 [Bryobacteraceae bacterium]|nr:hypothetical protein [Bryobacteraceae bacterium]
MARPYQKTLLETATAPALYLSWLKRSRLIHSEGGVMDHEQRACVRDAAAVRTSDNLRKGDKRQMEVVKQQSFVRFFVRMAECSDRSRDTGKK